MASLVVQEAILLQISILLIGKTIVKRKQDSCKRCSTVLQLIKDYPASKTHIYIDFQLGINPVNHVIVT
jgi:hypothetical protein